MRFIVPSRLAIGASFTTTKLLVEMASQPRYLFKTEHAQMLLDW